MRVVFGFTCALVSILAVTFAAHGLEKTSVRAAPERPGAWNTSATCTLAYYNTCTGWVWIWSGWDAQDQLGVQFDTGACSGGPGGTLVEHRMYVWTGTPAGRGFTGTIAVYDADDQDCPIGSPLGSQVFLPFSGWNT